MITTDLVHSVLSSTDGSGVDVLIDCTSNPLLTFETVVSAFGHYIFTRKTYPVPCAEDFQEGISDVSENSDKIFPANKLHALTNCLARKSANIGFAWEAVSLLSGKLGDLLERVTASMQGLRVKFDTYRLHDIFSAFEKLKQGSNYVIVKP